MNSQLKDNLTVYIDRLNKSLRDLYSLRERLHKLIGDFLPEAEARNRSRELYHVGKFLMRFAEDVKIISHTDQPDFIIRIGSRMIALEHSQLLRNETYQNRSVLELIGKAEASFKNLHPELRYRFTFWIDKTALKFKKHEKQTLILLLVDYAYKQVTGHVEEQSPPDFLIGFHMQEAPTASFHYNPGFVEVKYLPPDIITSRISEKEKRLQTYRQHYPGCEQVLLLVNEGLEADGFEIDKELLPQAVRSSFNRVYLFDTSTWKVHICSSSSLGNDLEGS